MAWVPDARNTVWGAISRAVRTPSRLESDAVSPIVTGSRGFDSERLVAFDAGFRTQPTDVLSLDLAAFYNVYDKLRTIENTVISNRMEGNGAGFELAGRWQVRPGWRLDAGYSELRMDLRVEPGSGDAASAAALEGADPHRQFVVGSLLDVTRRIEFEAFLRHTAGLRAAGVPSYLVMDLGLGWHPRPGVELSLAARNLFDSHHPEQATTTATEVRSDLFARIRWEF